MLRDASAGSERRREAGGAWFRDARKKDAGLDIAGRARRPGAVRCAGSMQR